MCVRPFGVVPLCLSGSLLSTGVVSQARSERRERLCAFHTPQFTPPALAKTGTRAMTWSTLLLLFGLAASAAQESGSGDYSSGSGDAHPVLEPSPPPPSPLPPSPPKPLSPPDPPPIPSPTAPIPPDSPPPGPPAYPGASYRYIVTFQVTVAGSIATFDAATYKTNLATVLGNGVTPADISVTLTAGSVIVATSVVTASSSAATSAANVLKSASTDTLSSDLGVTVTSVSETAVAHQVVVASPSPPPPARPPPPPAPPFVPPRPPTAGSDVMVLWSTVLADYFIDSAGAHACPRYPPSLSSLPHSSHRISATSIPAGISPVSALCPPCLF